LNHLSNSQALLNGSRTVFNANQTPSFGLGRRTALFNGNDVAYLALIAFVVRMHFGRAFYDLPVNRVGNRALYFYGYGLFSFIANDLTSNGTGCLFRHIQAPAF
jgi:hypothetical protein